MFADDITLEVARTMRELSARVALDMAVRQHGIAFVEAARVMLEQSKETEGRLVNE